MTATAERTPTEEAVAPPPPLAKLGVAVIAALSGIVLLLSTTRYGFFGDELYFMSAGDRLDVSYADQGPALPALAHLMDLIAPNSMVVLRLPGVLLAVGGIVVAALIARELGGGRGAQLLTAGGYATSPFLLGQAYTLATNTVDTALWTLITWLVVRWVRTRADWLLLTAALVTAIDFQVKWLIPFFWICLGVSALVFGPRELLRRPLLWVGAAVVVLTALPGLLWQANRGWPQLAMGAQIATEQDLVGGRWLFVPTMLLFVGLLGVPLLVYGTWRLFRAETLRPYRFLGLTMVLLVLAFLVQNGRPYYVAGMFPVLMAAGAVELCRRNLRSWARWLVVPLAVVSAGITLSALPWRAPAEIPAMDVPLEAALELQTYGRFGWPELAAATEDAYRALPPGVADRTVVVTDSYWKASAIDQLGADLPPVHSHSRGWWYFGAPPDSTTTTLYVSAQRPAGFDSVRRVATVNPRLGMPGDSRGVFVWRCDGPQRPWSAVWPERNELG